MIQNKTDPTICYNLAASNTDQIIICNWTIRPSLSLSSLSVNCHLAINKIFFLVADSLVQPSNISVSVNATRHTQDSPPEAAIEATPETTPFVTPIKVWHKQLVAGNTVLGKLNVQTGSTFHILRLLRSWCKVIFPLSSLPWFLYRHNNYQMCLQW